MSLTLRAGLSKADILAALRAAAATERGVVASDPDEIDPDPDVYIRPGFEHLADDDEDDAFSRFLGIRSGKGRYAWVELHFEDDGDGGWSCRADFRALSPRQTDVLLHFQSLVADGDWR